MRRPRLRRARASRPARCSSASRARAPTATTSPPTRSSAARSRSSSSAPLEPRRAAARRRRRARRDGDRGGRLLRRADARARGRRRHRHERQDDDGVPAPRRSSRRPAAGPGCSARSRAASAASVRPVVRTTPEAIDLQRTFREMLDAGDRSVALEASSHASVLRRLDRVRFDALVFTNLSQDHLDFHGTMERLLRGEAAALRRRRAAAGRGQRRRRVGAPARRRARGRGRAPLITFGFADDAEIRPDELVLDAAGARFAAGGIELETRLRGRFNVENVLGAVAAGIAARRRRGRDRRRGRARSRACRAASRRSTRASRSRCSSTTRTRRTRSTTCSARRASSPTGRVIVVFGAGGDRDRGKRPLMGKIAARPRRRRRS